MALKQGEAAKNHRREYSKHKQQNPNSGGERESTQKSHIAA
jgi:hypothetical protein